MPLQKINPSSIDTTKDFSFANVNISGALVDNGIDVAAAILSTSNTANAAFIQANAAFSAANNATDPWVRNQANSAFNAANSAQSTASAAFTQANAAYSLAQTGGGGGLTAMYTKTYYWKGGLVENVGTLRHYIPVATANLKSISSYLVTPGLTQSTAVIKKNGSAINTITFASGATSNTQSNLNIAIVSTDYLTVDITQSSSASDLYVNLVYQG